MARKIRIEDEPFNPRTTDREIRCVFHTVVVRAASVRGKFGGGVPQALESAPAVFNDEIVVLSYLNGAEAAGAIDILDHEGFVEGKDYCYFDATRATMYPGGRPARAQLQTIDLGCPWLGAYVSLKGELMVYLKKQSV